MPNTVSTPSSSRERTTDWAPVTFSGGTWRRFPVAAAAAGVGWEAEGAGLRAEGPGRAVGALTVFFLTACRSPLHRHAAPARRSSEHRSREHNLSEHKKAPVSRWLSEGGASQLRA